MSQLETAKEIMDATKDSLLDRLSNPLISSFAIAWSLWNYKFFVLLFSETKATVTFEWIDRICFPDAESIIFKGFLFPLLSALTYIYVLPFPTEYVLKFVLYQKKKQNDLRKEAAEGELLTEAEVRRHRREMLDLEERFKRDIDTLNHEKTRLEKRIQESQREVTTLKRRLDELEGPESALQERILDLFATVGRPLRVEDVYTRAGANTNAEARQEIERLIVKNKLMRRPLLPENILIPLGDPPYEWSAEAEALS
ncbi:hypothetical protein [Niveibacterium sp.]|uniref:hypothetical protein n=1 Tax=Niveibacterium sp. TaxID=2017444 RepID=UPI0035AEB8AC